MGTLQAFTVDTTLCCLTMALKALIAQGRFVAPTPFFSVIGFCNDIRDSGATHLLYKGDPASYLLKAPWHPLEQIYRPQCAHGKRVRSGT